MTMFNTYIFVDWSAVNTVTPQAPSPNAVWAGLLVPKLNRKVETYHRTRYEAAKYIENVIVEHVQRNRRVLVGFDFPYGYPIGLSLALALPEGSQSWWSVWGEIATRVQDSSSNNSNRFDVASQLNAIGGNAHPGPFWGCPGGEENANLSRCSPGFPYAATNNIELKRLRIVETRLPRTQETWKLFGAGSVGSQALVGIPYVYRLRRHPLLVHASSVWPFETSFTDAPTTVEGASVIHAEIWPGIVEPRVQELMGSDPGFIRDKAQVRAMCEWAAECDEAGELGGYFSQPSELTDAQVQACVQHEGWILGTP